MVHQAIKVKANKTKQILITLIQRLQKQDDIIFIIVLKMESD